MGLWLTLAEFKEIYTAARVDKFSDSSDVTAEEAILIGESAVRSRLHTRYGDDDLPTAPTATPIVLKRLSAALAFYALHDRDGLVSDDARRIRQDALDELVEVVNGLQSLTLAGPPDVDISSPTVSTRKRSPSLREEPITLEALDEW